MCSTPEFCPPAADRPMLNKVYLSFDRFGLFASMGDAIGYMSARDFVFNGFVGDRSQAVLVPCLGTPSWIPVWYQDSLGPVVDNAVESELSCRHVADRVTHGRKQAEPAK